MRTGKITIVKTLTWRFIALAITIVVFYIYTGNFKESFSVGLIANLLKMFFYYAHERFWNRLDFGRIKPPEYQI